MDLEHVQLADSANCPVSEVRHKLKSAGLVPTRQRIAIGWLLFGKGDRHFTADTLFEETRSTGSKLSLATIYNTLTQFKSAGLIREVATYGGKTWFDTQTGPHYHFFDEEQGKMTDIPIEMLTPIAAPQVPEGMELVGVDVVVRVRRSGS
ncbi:MAG: transcriptional repressor [Hyphomicrobiales bacterium]|nr:transcriptional repressor [Hyphomicrobiales bacterium]